MTLEENIRAILECNFSIAREEVIESTTKRIMEQILRQYPLEDELEKIKAKFEQYRDKWNYYGNEYEMTKYETYDVCIDEIDERISELKGENK